MGNTCRKQSFSSIRRCWGSGTSASTQQAVPQPSSGTPASSTNPPAQGNTPSSSNIEITNLVQLLQAHPTDVTKFEAILKFIDEALERRQDHSKFDLKVPSLIQANLEDASATLNGISALCQDKDGTRAEAELEKILSDALGALGSAHWITAGFSVVAFVLNRIVSTRDNRESSLDILGRVRDLGHHLVKLFDRIPNESPKFWRAGSVIVEAAIFCIKQLDAKYWKRFALVKVTTGDISSYKEKISGLYQDLGLTVNIQILESVPKPAPPYRPEAHINIIGREEIIDDVLGVMQLVPQKYQAILLHGLGGIGKTTIGDQIVAKSLNRFGTINIVRVEIGEEPSIDKIITCQRDIIEQLDCKQDVKDINGGRQLLCDCFKKCLAPILLFVDNVDQHDHLENLLPKTLFSDLPGGSYILVTSRSDKVSDAFSLSGVEWKECFVDDLKDLEAKDLFEYHLGGCPGDKRKQFCKVMGLCGGWPLAIEVVGSHLRRHKANNSMWTAAMSQLSHCKSVSNNPKDRLKKILDWSYDQVDEGCQDVFLDISCLLKGAEWSWCEALGAGSELSALEAHSLFKRVTRYDRNSYDSRNPRHDRFYDVVGAHDLVIALGRRKEKERSYGLGEGLGRVNWSGRSLPRIFGEDVNGVNLEAGEHVQGLVLKPAASITVHAQKLDIMSKSLRILCLSPKVRVEGQCQRIPRRLQICSTPIFPFRSLEGLDDLRVLHIACSKSMSEEVQFDAAMVPILPKSLRVLQLLRIASLKSFHAEAFQHCNSLQTVVIISCENLKALPDNICGVRTMRELHLAGNWALKTLPPQLHLLQALETFSFTGELDEFPAGLGSLQKLRKMTLCYEKPPESPKTKPTMEQRLYDMIGELGELECLQLEGWWGLTRLCDDFSKLMALRELSLQGCESLTQLPGGFENLHALQKLTLQGCKLVTRVCDDFSKLTALKELSLQGCELLTQLPEGFENLHALQKLTLQGCKLVTRVCDDFSKLTALKELSLRGCELLTQLPEGFENLHTLQKLSLHGCKSLTQLPEGFEKLHALLSLDLGGCHSLESLPEGFSHLSSLESLNLSSCRLVRHIPGRLENLLMLSTLKMSDMESLKLFLDMFPRLPTLKSLKIDSRVVESCNLSTVQCLESLHLTDCETMVQLPGGLERLSALKTFKINSCPPLSEFLSGFGKLLFLESLDITMCGSLKNIPNHVGGQVALEEMVLTQLCNDFSKLTALKELKLSLQGCESLTQLPGGFENLHTLQKLTLQGCKLLTGLCHDFSKLTALKELSLPGCELLTQLPGGFENLHTLQKLSLHGCKSLTQLPEGFEKLHALLSLDLGGCHSLESLPEGFSHLSSLENLDLSSCRLVRHIPGQLENLLMLSTLRMSEMGSLKLFSDMFPQLPTLKSLKIDSRVVASCNLSTLQCLEELYLTDCETLVQLPAGLEKLSALTTFKIICCPRLSEFPSGFGKLVSLKSLDITRCSSLKIIPDDVGKLAALEKLILEGCKDLKHVPDSICELKGLRMLKLAGGRFIKLPENLGDVSALEYLYLEGCVDLQALPSSISRLKHLKTVAIPSDTDLRNTEMVTWLEDQDRVRVHYWDSHLQHGNEFDDVHNLESGALELAEESKRGL